jgi:TonB family protein
VVTFVAAAALALIWAGARMLGTQQPPLLPPTADIVENAGADVSAPSQPANEATLATPGEQAVPSVSTNPGANVDTPADPEPEATVSGAHEVLPDVPRRARQTIRGHVKVSVRVIVDPDGTVFAALVDDRGPSKYFARLAIDAAKKWTFAAADTDGQRLIQLRFDFTRDGTTMRAVPLK